MNILQSFKMAMKSIMGNKMRSFLTMLGIIIGVASVIILVSLVNGQMSYMTESFASIGTNQITVNVTNLSTRSVSVDEMYDLLVEFENYIVGETIIPIVNTLAGLPGTELADIQRVYSKGVALMQASRFLDEHGDWQQISVANTAIAAKKVLDEQDKTQAAIASESAGEFYWLSVLKRNIFSNQNNSTRFIIVTNQKIFLKDAKKISICFELPHESGSLYHLLSHFIYNDLNMTRIESRPVEGKNWEYRFFIDFEGNLADPAVKNAIRGLREESINLKILGNY